VDAVRLLSRPQLGIVEWNGYGPVARLRVVTDMPAPPRMRTVEEVFGSAFAEEEAFQAALDQSLAPRGSGLLFDLVAGLGLPPGSAAVDVGAGEGYYCIELARRFGFTVHGVEPVRRHLDNAARALAAFAAAEPEIAARIRIDQGIAGQLPDPDASADLIWCRDVLEHVPDLEAAFGEFRRVLRPGGHAVIYQMTATDWLTPAEAARLWPPVGVYASSVDPQHFEAAIAAAGLTIDQGIQLHGEWRERAEEDRDGLSSRPLLWASRLLRNRAAYEERFGTGAYQAMLTDSLWCVYQMIGKLNPRLYVLSR
jgi:SAM-dependent methyltransferase